jgi:hypothetical protein
LQHNGTEAARKAGVNHIVKLSAFGAGSLFGTDLPLALADREAMKKSGMDWTILQPHHFMRNLLTPSQYIINDGWFIRYPAMAKFRTSIPRASSGNSRESELLPARLQIPSCAQKLRAKLRISGSPASKGMVVDAVEF